MGNVLSKVQVNGTEYDFGLPVLGSNYSGDILGKPNDDNFIGLMKIGQTSGDGYGICIDSSVFFNDTSGLSLKLDSSVFSTNGNGLTLVNGGIVASEIIWNTGGGGSSSHNMNEFTTPGVYEIYGERVNHSDNLPINNVGGYGNGGYGGHSFYGKLTVLSSALRKNDGSDPTEISVTQILMLSNRKGGDGNIYYRSYNQNNSPFEDGWSNWKKVDGTEEGYVFTNTKKLNQDWGLQTVNVGLNYMVDNGTYSGVYVNEDAILQQGELDAAGNGWGSINTDITKITYVETFHITTINDYAVAGQVNNMLDQIGNQTGMDMSAYKKDRQICQFKMATDLFSGTTSFKKRVYKGNNAYYGVTSNWSDWEDIGGGGSYTLPKATFDTLGGIKIGTELPGSNIKLGIDNNSFAGIGISGAFYRNDSEVLDFNWGDIADYADIAHGIPLHLGSAFKISNIREVSPDAKPIVPLDDRYFSVNNRGLTINPNASFGDSTTKVTWDANSNMNNFKIGGVYDIYGERTKHDDNLPINNASSGHSIRARLFVIDSSLQPASEEICITQFLMLSNRTGGDGNMYYRTYNQNNSPAADGWGVWKKVIGTEEGYIFTDTWKMNQDGGLQTRNVGLNYMVDNGTYSGVYVNSEAIQKDENKPWNDEVGNGSGKFTTNIADIKFIETFNITTINDYAVAGVVNNLLQQMGQPTLERQICQVKVATNIVNGTSSIKKRVYKGNDADYGNSTKWSDWKEISGGGEGEKVPFGPIVNMFRPAYKAVVKSQLLNTPNMDEATAEAQATIMANAAGLPEIFGNKDSENLIQSNITYEIGIGSALPSDNDPIGGFFRLDGKINDVTNGNKIQTHFLNYINEQLTAYNTKYGSDGKYKGGVIKFKRIYEEMPLSKYGGLLGNSDRWEFDIYGSICDHANHTKNCHCKYVMGSSLSDSSIAAIPDDIEWI